MKIYIVTAYRHEWDDHCQHFEPLVFFTREEAEEFVETKNTFKPGSNISRSIHESEVVLIPPLQEK